MDPIALWIIKFLTISLEFFANCLIYRGDSIEFFIRFSLPCGFDSCKMSYCMNQALGVLIMHMCVPYFLYTHVDGHLGLLSFDTSSG